MPVTADELLRAGTVRKLFRLRAAANPDRAFMSAKYETGVPQQKYIDTSWAETARQILDCAYGLMELGVERGDRIAIFAANRPRWIVADQAIWAVGAVSTPIYPTSTPAQVKHILDNSGSTVVFVGDEGELETVAAIRSQCVNLKTIVSFEPIGGDSQNMVIGFDDLLKSGRESRGNATDDPRTPEPDEPAAIIYTSGTTGEPKGAVLTHGNLWANLVQLMGTPLFAAQLRRDFPMTCLCHLPLCHVYGRLTDYHTQIMLGGVIAFAQSFKTVPENLFEVRPHIVNSIPRFYEKAYSTVMQAIAVMDPQERAQFDRAFEYGKKFSQAMVKGKTPFPTLGFQLNWAYKTVFRPLRLKLGFDRLVLANSGGGPLPPEIMIFFRNLLIMMSQGYGLTETSPVLTHQMLSYKNPDHIPTFFNKLGVELMLDVMVKNQSLGQSPFSGLNLLKIGAVGVLLLPDCMIEDGAVGRPVKDTLLKINPDGEILAKGPQVFSQKLGYWKNPSETAAAFDDDGWFKTGDIGKIGDTMHLTITDRKKDLLVTAGGKNIAPNPIELKLAAKPYIEYAVVIGEGRKFISALISPNTQALRTVLAGTDLAKASRKELSTAPEVQQLIWKSVAEVNKELAHYEQIKMFEIIPDLLTEQTGELTPTQKIKRRIVEQRYKDLIDAMYGG